MQKLCNSRVHATLIASYSSFKVTPSLRFCITPAIVQEKNILIQLKSTAALMGGIMVKLRGVGGGEREFRLEGSH